MSSSKKEVSVKELVVTKGIKLGHDNCMLSRLNPFDIGHARVESDKIPYDHRNRLMFSFRQDTGGYDMWGYMTSDPN